MAKKKPKTKSEEPKTETLESVISKYKWSDSVIYLEQVDMYIACLPPKMLKENPKNWRIHTQRQRTTYNQFKDKYGWLGFAIFNLYTEKLLDGHMRVDEAIQNKEEYVPVRLVYVDEVGENEILSTFDNIGNLAQRNNEALESLIKASNSEAVSKVKNSSEQKLQQLRNDLTALVKSDKPSVMIPLSKTKVRVTKEEPEEDIEDDEPADSFEPKHKREAVVSRIDPSVIFEGATHLGIPIFLPEKICSPDNAPSKTYIGKEDSKHHYYCYSQSQIHDELEVGTIGFYVDDYKFESIYDDPEPFIDWALEINPTALVTPDFSAYTSWPMAKNLIGLYRNRWVGRLWQEVGFDIIPSVQILDKSLTQSITYSLETLPKYCPTVAIECRNSHRSDMSNVVKWINTIVDVVKPECFVLYGGEEKQKLIHGDLKTTYKRGKQSVKVDYRYLPLVITEKKKARKRS